MSLESQANVIADKKAKEELRKGNLPGSTRYVRGQSWTATCEGQPVTGNAERRLRLLMQKKKSRKWWIKKLKINEVYANRIAWDVYQSYRQSTPKRKNNWSVKFGAGILPTQANLTIRGHGNNTVCPCCGEVIEDTDHLFQCPSEETTKTFDDERDKIYDYLSATTSADIMENILRLLDFTRFGNPPELIDDSPIAKVAYHQALMGQRATLNGVWHKGWLDIQETFLKRSGGNKSAKVWLLRLTLMIQNMTHAMWLTRNEAVHKNEDSAMNKKMHEDLDSTITTIFRDLPPRRAMPTCDAAFFKRGEVRIKRYRLRRKELWVADAIRIQEAFYYNLNPTSESFLNFFGPPTNT